MIGLGSDKNEQIWLNPYWHNLFVFDKKSHSDTNFKIAKYAATTHIAVNSSSSRPLWDCKRQSRSWCHLDLLVVMEASHVCAQVNTKSHERRGTINKQQCRTVSCVHIICAAMASQLCADVSGPERDNVLCHAYSLSPSLLSIMHVVRCIVSILAYMLIYSIFSTYISTYIALQNHSQQTV